MLTIALIAIGLLTVGIVILMIRDLGKSERLDAFTKEKHRIAAQETKPSEPPKPRCIMAPNDDGQLSIYHEPAGTYAVTFYTPWHISRQESRDMAIGILKRQGADGIAAAKTFIGEVDER